MVKILFISEIQIRIIFGHITFFEQIHDISNDWDKSQDHYCDASLIRELPPHCDSNPNSQNWTAPEGDEYSMVLNSSYPKLLIIKLANITGPDVTVTQKPNRKELHVVQSVKHSLA
ncbi:hypothetical protein KL928_000788 [Ogataea angusta]|uniref:Uncharacterized protein n=1 Tax=Pichia angusta TaxID=870730 RepID=A0AAN6DJZ3_PICAN|nr:uncharacterized protein KL928_000788 [Ogataea angusta]KAG7822313.1 hypothetical protein KL928_000788 [Ogataea angusta]